MVLIHSGLSGFACFFSWVKKRKKKKDAKLEDDKKEMQQKQEADKKEMQ